MLYYFNIITMKQIVIQQAMLTSDYLSWIIVCASVVLNISLVAFQMVEVYNPLLSARMRRVTRLKNS